MWFLALLVAICCLSYGFGEELTVDLETLVKGTDGQVRIRFSGTFGESDYLLLGDKGYFSQAKLQRSIKVLTNQQIGSVLKITLTVTEGSNINVGRVIVSEPDQRQINFQFNEYISQGQLISRDAPTPDLSQPIVNYETDISNVTASPTYTETAGSPFRLHVLVSRLADATGEITYQWYKLNAAESSIPVAVADGGKSAVLRIGSVKIGDEGSYFCVARLKNSVRKSDSIILTVNYLTMEPIEVNIKGSSFIEEGKSVDFVCGGSSNLPAVNVSWFRNNQLLVSDVTRVALRLEAITRNHSGEYTCQARAEGFKEIKTETINVKVIYLNDPVIRGHTVINNTLTLLSNQSSELHCDSESSPSSVIYTFKENGAALLNTNNNNNFFVKTGGGNYSCTVKNDFITKTISFKVIAGSLKGPDGNSGSGNSGASTNADGNEFWTTEMIVIVIMAIAFFIILILLIVFICCLIKRVNKRGHDNDSDVKMTKPKFTPQTDFQNNYIHDTLTSERGPTLGDIQKQTFPDETATSHLSLSSDEYKSSTNDIRQNTPHPNGHVSSPDGRVPVSNGNLAVPSQPPIIITNSDYATVNKKARDKERQSKSQKKSKDERGERKWKHRKGEHSVERKNKHRHHNRSHEEIGESSKAGDDELNDSRVNQSYDSVEYC